MSVSGHLGLAPVFGGGRHGRLIGEPGPACAAENRHLPGPGTNRAKSIGSDENDMHASLKGEQDVA
jgi:hypothetical protein